MPPVIGKIVLENNMIGFRVKGSRYVDFLDPDLLCRPKSGTKGVWYIPCPGYRVPKRKDEVRVLYIITEEEGLMVTSWVFLDEYKAAKSASNKMRKFSPLGKQPRRRPHRQPRTNFQY